MIRIRSAAGQEASVYTPSARTGSAVCVEDPAVPPRACAGYIIIQALRLDSSHEIVIGHNPSAAAPYVCWDCRNGDDYNTGGYCQTYRQALLVLSDRLHDRYDYLPREYRC